MQKKINLFSEVGNIAVGFLFGLLSWGFVWLLFAVAGCF
jgi:hypothetical protein